MLPRFRTKKRECEIGACADFEIDRNMNCVNECVSSECYAEHYALEPLEDGEVDSKRGRSFTACVRKEHAARRTLEQKERRAKRKREQRGEEE